MGIMVMPGGIALPFAIAFITGGPMPPFFIGGMPPFDNIGLPIGGALIVDSGLLPSLAPFAPIFGEFIFKCGLIRLPFGPIFAEFIGLELFIREPLGEFMPKCAFGPTFICAN